MVVTLRRFFDIGHTLAHDFSYFLLTLRPNIQYNIYMNHGLVDEGFLNLFFLGIKIHFQGYHSSELATLSLFWEGKNRLIFYSCV